MRLFVQRRELISEILSKPLDFFFLGHVVSFELCGELAHNIRREALRTIGVEEQVPEKVQIVADRRQVLNDLVNLILCKRVVVG